MFLTLSTSFRKDVYCTYNMNPFNKYLIITKCQTLYKVGYSCEKRQKSLPTAASSLSYNYSLQCLCDFSRESHIPQRQERVKRF